MKNDKKSKEFYITYNGVISSDEKIITAHKLGMINEAIDCLPRIDEGSHQLLTLNKGLSF